MVRLLLAVIFAAAVLLPSRYEFTAVTEAAGDNPSAKQPPPEQRETGIGKLKPDTAQAEIGKKQGIGADDVAKWAAIALAPLTFALALIGFGQVFVAIRTARRQLRAYVFILESELNNAGWVPSPEKGQQPLGHVHFKNF